MIEVAVTGGFDDLRSRQVRFLEQASKIGRVHVFLWPDAAVRALEGKSPLFQQEERLYFVGAIRYVNTVSLATGRIQRDAIPDFERLRPDVWVVSEQDDDNQKRAYCAARHIKYCVLNNTDLKGFPETQIDLSETRKPAKKVLVTGCFDWLHSGHVRFFEEVSELGDLYVVVGHDANVRLLKGAGHPLFPEDERRFMVQSIRYVKQAFISSGDGWLDAAPEVARIKPDIYAVNEDSDKPEKREFCEEHGLEYVVLKRLPKEGLPKRESTTLRGF